MFDLFGRNNDDNRRDDGRPRIVFANLRRPNRPILTEGGYKTFSATTFSIWTLIVLMVWVFRVEVSPSKDLITSLASSSVELAALSLAVLGVLHELNKEDKWFKFGLFLISVLFVSVVFGGFFLAFTWQPTFDLPQQITIIVVVALGIVAITQLNWTTIFRFTRISWIINFTLPTGVTNFIQRTRLVLPFCIPFFLIWFPDLNRLTTVIVLFAGALIALVVLMGVTIVSLLTSKTEIEPEDPFIATLRARYENEIKSLVRFGELKVRAIDALRRLQVEKIEMNLEQNSSSRVKQAPQMVEISYIVEHLRGMGITEDKQIIDSVMSSLVDEKVICRDGYSGPYWLIPKEEEINRNLTRLENLALITSVNPIYKDAKYKYAVKGYDFTHLRDWLALQTQTPTFVVGEYVIPRVLNLLLNGEPFHIIKKWSWFIFVNKKWKISLNEWKDLLNNAIINAKEECEHKNRGRYRRMDAREEENFIHAETWRNLLKHLPHICDDDDATGDASEIAMLASILTE